MKIKPVKNDIGSYLRKYQLEKKFLKAKNLFEQDITHPSLNVEILEPERLKIYSFRIDKKYRAIFAFSGGEVEIIAITNHYK